MRIVVYVLVLVFLALAQLANGGEGVALRPGVILSEIQARGPRAVVRELYDNGGNWSALLDAVASGAPEWLAVAKKLRPGTDAGASNMLEISVFYALGNAPIDTLKLLSPQPPSASSPFAIEMVCSNNFLIDYPANQSALSLIDERIVALRTVGETNLIATRDLCIESLERARRNTLRIMGEAK